MNKDINDIWQKLASIQAKDDIDALRIDPTIKASKQLSCHYFKYYLRKYLDPAADDVILEVGCGIGRLSEYISPFAGSVYGIDR
jgi:2-polyprenyl-3-methyl-5-hydroxy-6-metoxy-1,4-benzoquinol methylase